MPRKARKPRTRHTRALEDAICRRISAGESLITICADDGMPSIDAIWLWRRRDQAPGGFSERFRSARELQADAIYEEMATVEAKVARGEIRADVGRTMLNSMQWRASKMLASVFGDAKKIEHTGTIGLSALTDEELEREVADLSAQIKNPEKSAN